MTSAAPRNYCTYFDSRYLPRGLALHESLQRHDTGSHLWVLALDQACEETLASMHLPGLHVVALRTLEEADKPLREARANRSLVEYYFTLSPCWPRYLLRSHADLDGVTYMDADMLMLSGPSALFADLEGASVAITPHRFPPRLRHLERYGMFNVGWLTYRRCDETMNCLDWWRDRCLEYCHDRLDAGRFADQKYLDEFPQRFPGVRTIEHEGVNLAPWNLDPASLQIEDGVLRVKGRPVVAYHFQGVKPLGGDRFDCALDDYGIRMSPLVREHLYRPYLRRLRELAERHALALSSSARASRAVTIRKRLANAIERGRALAMGSMLRA
jgi:hypothetical protein